jgi:tyrosinase
MASFFTAGLDPVFWMHHANVDRLWETYAHDLGHGYPFPGGRPAGGLAAQAFDSWSQRKFRFLRSSGAVKDWTAPQLLDTESLGYRYETTAAPVFNPVPNPPAGGEIEPFGLERLDFAPIAAVSNVGVSDAATVPLKGGDGIDGAGFVEPGQRWNIRFDGIRCERPAVSSYAVYIGLDDEDAPDESRLLGTLSLFGVFESSLERNGDPGSSRLFDATSVVSGIRGFDPLAARLTLIPTSDRDLDGVHLTVERISLEVG